MEEMIVHTAQNNCFVMQHLAKSALFLLKYFIWVDFFFQTYSIPLGVVCETSKKGNGYTYSFCTI